MPRGDRTGPFGMGPRTGRGLGYCSGYSYPGYTSPGPGLGFGRGFGRGLGGGFGRGFGMGRAMFGGVSPYYAGIPQITEEQELQYLKQESDVLNQQMKEVQKRIKDLESKKE
jgi:hypothetical protein